MLAALVAVLVLAGRKADKALPEYKAIKESLVLVESPAQVVVKGRRVCRACKVVLVYKVLVE